MMEAQRYSWHLSNRGYPNFIKDRTTKGSEVITPSMVVWTVKCNSCPGWNGFELETCGLGFTLSFGFERNFKCITSGECLDHHGSMATIPGVSDREWETVDFVGSCSEDLGNCTFSSCNKLNSSESERNIEVLFVNELHGFKRFNHPARERRCEIFLSRGKEDAVGGVY